MTNWGNIIRLIELTSAYIKPSLMTFFSITWFLSSKTLILSRSPITFLTSFNYDRLANAWRRIYTSVTWKTNTGWASSLNIWNWESTSSNNGQWMLLTRTIVDLPGRRMITSIFNEKEALSRVQPSSYELVWGVFLINELRMSDIHLPGRIQSLWPRA